MWTACKLRFVKRKMQCPWCAAFDRLFAWGNKPPQLSRRASRYRVLYLQRRKRAAELYPRLPGVRNSSTRRLHFVRRSDLCVCMSRGPPLSKETVKSSLRQPRVSAPFLKTHTFLRIAQRISNQRHPQKTE